MSSSLWTHGLQHTGLPCPSPSPRVHPTSCPLNQWYYPWISSSATLFSSCLQYFPSSVSFPICWLFTSGGQSIGASASALPSGPISFTIDRFDCLADQGTLKSLLQHHSSKASILQHSAFFQLSHLYMTTVKTIVLTIWTFVGKMMSLLFSILSRFVIAFLPMSKCLLISWL